MRAQYSFNIIVSAILVLIIVLVVSLFFSGTTWRIIKGFLGIGFDEKETSSTEMRCVKEVCSMKALVCAVNSVILGKPAWLDNKCPDGYYKPKTSVVGNVIRVVGLTTKSNGCDIKYGDVCIMCFGSPKESLGLNSEKDKAIKQLVRMTISCYNDFQSLKKSMLCNRVYIPKEAEWDLNLKEFKEALMKEAIGKEILGRIEWKLKGDKEFIICASQRTLRRDKIVFTTNPANCGVDKDKFACKVVGFELPQDISGLDKAKDFIFGYGDPYLLAYFESFPKGEEKAWQFDSKRLFMIGLAIRGVFTLIPFSGALRSFKELPEGFVNTYRIKKLAKIATNLDNLDDVAKAKKLKEIAHILEKLSKKERYLLEGIETLAKIGIENPLVIYADSFLDDIADEIYKVIKGVEFSDEGIILLKTKIKRIFDNSGVDFSEKEFNKLTDELIEKSKKGLNDVEDVKNFLSKYKSKVIETIAGDLDSLPKIGKIMGFKKMVRSLFLIDKKGNFIRSSLKEPLENVVKNMNALRRINPELFEQMLEKSEKLAYNFIDDAGRVNFQALLGDTSDEAIETFLGLAQKGEKTELVFKEPLENIKDLLSFKTWGKGLWKGSVTAVAGPISGETKWEITQQIIRNTARGLGCVGLTKNMRRLCLKFVREHYLPILLGLGYLYQLYDNDLKKYLPVGSANFALTQPEVYGKPTLNFDAVKDYYVFLLKKDSKVRFYAASPCKTDYIVTKSYIQCNPRHREYFYPLKEEDKTFYQPIDPIATSTEYLKPVYVWDLLDEKQKLRFLTEPNYFKKHDWRGEGFWQSGFSTILTILLEDKELVKEFFNLVYDDKEAFLWVYYDGNYKELKDNKGNVREISKFGDEQYKNFINAFVEHYFEDYYNGYVTEFEFNPKDVRIRIPKMIINPLIKFLYPVGNQWLAGIYWEDRKELGKLIYFINGKMVEDSWPWLNPDAPWEERLIDWEKFKYLAQSGISKFRILKVMLAHKFYNSELFQKLARRAALQYIIYDGPKDKVVKHCYTSEEVEAPTDITKEYPAKIVIPAIAIKADMNSYKDYNGGYNFCYSDKSPWLRYAQYGFDAVGVVTGLALGAFTGGWPALLIPAAADVGSIAISFIIEMCGDWPHHSPNFRNCI